MSAPTTLTIVYVSTPPSTTSTATVAIPAALVSLNASQDESNATGFASYDVVISSIFRRGFFYANSTAIPTDQIVSITWS